MRKSTTYYAPYIRIKGQRKWHRATDKNDNPLPPYFKDTAVRVYQSWLLEPYLHPTEENANQERGLRPLPTIYTCYWCEGNYKPELRKYKGMYRKNFCSDKCFEENAISEK